MSTSVRTLAAALTLAAGMACLAGSATALPLASGLALKNAAPTAVETVRWRGRGFFPGFFAGAVLGGALAAPYYYGPGPYYYGPGPYVAPGPYPAPVAGDAVAYCMSRFRSYDPASGTYLGYDGLRHPCP
jgi:BA14K-like protein